MQTFVWNEINLHCCIVGEKISFDGRKKSGYRIKFSEYVVHSSLLKKGDCIRFGMEGIASKIKKKDVGQL